MVVGSDRLALKDREARVNPISHDLDLARRDLFPCEQRLDELVAEKLDEAGRIGGRSGNERSFRGNQAFGHQTVQMRMKPAWIVTVGLQRGDHTGDGAAIALGILEEFLDRRVETLTERPGQLAVVLEREAEHLGDGHDVLAHGEIAQDLFVDVLGKEQGALLVA